MRAISLPLEQINIKDFLSESLNEGKKFIGVPIFFVDDITDFDFDDIFDKYEKTNIEVLYSEMNNGTYLFVTFSDCGINYPEVPCIDGNEYLTLEKDEEEEYFEDGTPDDFVFTNNIHLGENSCLGYLIKVDHSQVTIQTSQFFIDSAAGIGPSSLRHVLGDSAIVPIEDVEVFEKPMREYLDRFIIKN